MIVSVLHQAEDRIIPVSLLHLVAFKGAEDAFGVFFEGYENLQHGQSQSGNYCIRENRLIKDKKHGKHRLASENAIMA